MRLRRVDPGKCGGAPHGTAVRPRECPQPAEPHVMGRPEVGRVREGSVRPLAVLSLRQRRPRSPPLGATSRARDSASSPGHGGAPAMRQPSYGPLSTETSRLSRKRPRRISSTLWRRRCALSALNVRACSDSSPSPARTRSTAEGPRSRGCGLRGDRLGRSRWHLRRVKILAKRARFTGTDAASPYRPSASGPEPARTLGGIPWATYAIHPDSRLGRDDHHSRLAP